MIALLFLLGLTSASMVTLTPETATIPTTAYTSLVLATVRAPAPGPGERRPLDLIVVVDRSGSMASEDKMPMVRETLSRAVGLLGDQDRLGLVAFHHEVAVPLELTLDRSAARAAITGLDVGGNTNLAGGLLSGIEMMKKARSGAICAIILLTDGEANTGIVDPREIFSAVRAHETRCAIHTFGYGVNHNQALLRTLTAGGGGYFYVRTARDVGELFGRALGSTQSVFAEDAKLDLRVAGGERIVRFLGKYKDVECRTEWPGGHRCTVQLGPLLSEQDRHILFEVEHPEHTWASTIQSLLSYQHQRGGDWATEHGVDTDLLIPREPGVPGAINTTVNAQRMRVLAGEAMAEAAALGHADKRELGRQRLTTLLADLRAAPSKDEPLVKALIKDVEEAIEAMRDPSAWLTHGQVMVGCTANTLYTGALTGAGHAVALSSSTLAKEQALALTLEDNKVDL